MIEAELPPGHELTLHPRTQAGHACIPKTGELRQEGEGMDFTRYEGPKDLLDRAGDKLSEAEKNRRKLRACYIAQTYLNGRNTNLNLLDKHGGNAWLIGNSQLEDNLRPLELAIHLERTEARDTEAATAASIEAVRDNVVALEETWRSGLGRCIEAEVACEDLKARIQVICNEVSHHRPRQQVVT